MRREEEIFETEEEKSDRNRRCWEEKTGYLKDCSSLKRQRWIQASNTQLETASNNWSTSLELGWMQKLRGVPLLLLLLLTKSGRKRVWGIQEDLQEMLQIEAVKFSSWDTENNSIAVCIAIRISASKENDLALSKWEYTKRGSKELYNSSAAKGSQVILKSDRNAILKPTAAYTLHEWGWVWSHSHRFCMYVPQLPLTYSVLTSNQRTGLHFFQDHCKESLSSVWVWQAPSRAWVFIFSFFAIFSDSCKAVVKNCLHDVLKDDSEAQWHILTFGSR